MPGYNGDKPEPILSPPSSHLRGAKLPKSNVLVGCQCQESECGGECSFQCLLYYWRVYAKAFYVRYIIKLFRISTKIDYLCIDRPFSVSLALHRRLFPRCSAALAAGCAVCTIFRMHDTTFFSSSWCTFEIICPKFSINSRYTHIDEKGVNHFWALRFDAETKAVA